MIPKAAICCITLLHQVLPKQYRSNTAVFRITVLAQIWGEFMMDTSDTSIDASVINALMPHIEQELLPSLQLVSLNPRDPVHVQVVPDPWQVIGTGNYAAVFVHPQFVDLVVKIYAPDRPGIQDEIQVYQQLGSHPTFSQCFYADDRFLILKRIHGITLYDCVHEGIFIPPIVIQDVDRALEYARQQGLRPHDVHGRNVMMSQGRGIVVDISDFLHEGRHSQAWSDLRWAYCRLYLPIFSRFCPKVPYFYLNLIRKLHQWLRR